MIMSVIGIVIVYLCTMLAVMLVIGLMPKFLVVALRVSGLDGSSTITTGDNSFPEVVQRIGIACTAM